MNDADISWTDSVGYAEGLKLTAYDGYVTLIHSSTKGVPDEDTLYTIRMPETVATQLVGLLNDVRLLLKK